MNPYPVLFAAVIAPAAAADQSPIVEAYTHDLADPSKSRIADVVIDGWWKLIEPGPVKPDRPFSNNILKRSQESKRCSCSPANE